MADFKPPKLKTKLGQHDFHKPACAEFCKLSKQYCPFIKQERKKIDGIVRWTDLMDRKDSSEENTYTADFSKKEPDYIINSMEESSSSSYRHSQVETQMNNGRYSCWGDGTGFEYDIMSRNVIGPSGPVQSIYDITNYQIHHQVLKQSEWNAWIDKFQYDYRFGRVSDTNAECILFPNVDNPWMFTEYVFKGIAGNGKICALEIPEQYIVQPPIYDPQTLQLINGDFTINDKTDYDEKYKQILKNVESNNFKEEQSPYIVKQFRRIQNWSDLVPDFEGKENYKDISQTCADVGLKLYRAKIPVQSVKWGQHGNIPPHTLDMTAPKEWFDPDKTIGKVKVVYNAHVGSPIYACADGVVQWNNSIPSIYTNIVFTEYKQNGRVAYKYEKENESSIQVPVPKRKVGENEKGQKHITPIMGTPGNPEYCHGGCQYCVGKTRVLRCSYLDSLNNDSEIEKMNAYFKTQYCLKENYGGKEEKCPHFIPSRRYPVIATYQAERVQVDQTTLYSDARNSLASVMIGGAAGVGGVLVGAEMGLAAQGAFYAKLLNTYQNLGKRGDLTITYTKSYEIQPASKNQAQLNKQLNKRDEFGKGVQIVPGTGKYAFDSEENANVFSGGDTNVYNDISTLSFHRFFRSVMHCSSPQHCNIFTGQSQRQGYSLFERAKGNGQCRYYNLGKSSTSTMGCPYNCPPKRAIQFGNVLKQASSHVEYYMRLYERMCYYGIWQLPAATENGVNGATENSGVFKQTVGLYAWLNVGDDNSGKIGWVIFNDWAVGRKIDSKETISIIAVKQEKSSDFSSYFGGAALLDDENCPQGFKLFCEIRTKTSKTIWVDTTPWYEKNQSSSSSSNEYEKIAITTVECLQGFFWYCPLYNDGTKINSKHISFVSDALPKINSSESSSSEDKTPQHLKQTVDKNGYWFCMATSGDNVIPTTNCVMIDNEQKFIGGWHPEYKDYSKLGPEFMQEIVSDESRQGQGMGDYVNNGDYTPIPQKTSKQGYWIDQSGQYIIDQRSTGWNQPIASPDQRQNNSGPGACISFKKSNTTTNPETGQTIPPMTINGAVFSNDPAYFWMSQYGAPYRAVYNKQEREWEGGHPWFEHPIKDDEYYAPCYIGNISLLPTMRMAIHCPKCDYYLTIKYVNTMHCPWCGEKYEIITGSDGSQYWKGQEAHGDTWENASAENVPPVIKKFFKLNAIGNVDVWAPPGTGIKTDAYFWKHQTQINNAHKKQLYHKLGVDEDNKVSMNKLTATSEMTLGYPESIGKFQRVPMEKNYDLDENKRYTHVKWYQGEDTKENVIKPFEQGSYNSIMPRHMIPGFYENKDTGEQDEGIIAPYSINWEDNTVFNDALKSISLDEMIKLRNMIQPIYAYSSQDLYGADYPTFRASYNARTKKDQPIIFQNKRATIKPVVLANTGGSDAYQQYYSGDLVYGNVREYFPNGYTWWYMKQLLGGRASSLTGGEYHMDDGTKGWAPNVCYPTTNTTVARCALSIYGLLPLDKQILAAYAIVYPDSTDPSKDPVGRSWTGGPVMYHHYHAQIKEHFEDGKYRHLHGTAGYPPDTYFDDDGNFVDERGPGIRYYSDDVEFQDESANRLWGQHGQNSDDDRNMYYDDNFINTMTNLPAMYDTTFYRNVGTPKKEIILFNEGQQNSSSSSSSGVEKIYYGYDNESFPDIAGWTVTNSSNTERKRKQKYKYIVLNEENNIFQNYPNSMIWRNLTQEQIEKEIEINTGLMQIGASTGTPQSQISYVFTEINSNIYGNLAPEQSQSIPGYFDLSWTNSRGYVYNDYSYKQKKFNQWDAPVIFQADQANKSDYSGASTNIGTQMGTTARCIDVTSIVRNLYNKRIQRVFNAKGGNSFDKVSKWKYFESLIESDDNDGIYKQNSQIHNQEEQFDNNDWDEGDGSNQESSDSSGGDSGGNQTLQSSSSSSFSAKDFFPREIEFEKLGKSDYTLLSQPYTYPDLGDNYNVIPSISSDGDKYQLKPYTTYLFANIKKYPTSINNPYKIKIKINDEQDKQVSIDGSSISGAEINGDSIVIKIYDVFENFIKCIFDGFEVEISKVSNYKIKITSTNKIKISSDSDFFKEDGQILVRDRILQVSSYQSNYHPSKFLYQNDGAISKSKDQLELNSFGWKYRVYSPQPQYFVMDLLRAPLLIKKQDWRYQQGYTDYSGAVCPNEDCQASKSNCSVAANNRNIFFNGRTAECPCCGSSLENAKGVTQVPGDGIKTYFYDQPFAENPFIRQIDSLPGVGIYNCDYKIFGRYSENENWTTLVTYDKNVSTNQIQMNDKFHLAKHNRYRFVKVQCDSNAQLFYYEYKINDINGYEVVIEPPDGSDFSEFEFVQFNNMKIKLARKSFLSEIPSYENWCNGSADSGVQEPPNDMYANQDYYGYNAQIVSYQLIEDNKKLKFILDVQVPNEISTTNFPYLQIFLIEYVGGLSAFSVWGTHYKDKQGGTNVLNSDGDGSADKYLTMTDNWKEYSVGINASDFKYRLLEPPNQIFDVSIGKKSGQITLQEYLPNNTSLIGNDVVKNLYDENNTDFGWNITKKFIIYFDTNGFVKEAMINKIIGGKYFYDAANGYIYLPIYARYQDGKKIDKSVWSEQLNIINFEKDLNDTYLSLSYLPDTLTIRYSGGNGESVTLKALAAQHGPSYMLEKNSIQNIINKTSLPDNGTTCKIRNQTGDILRDVQIQWHCCNNKPSSLSIEDMSKSETVTQGTWHYNSGQFRVPNFGGGEIGSCVGNVDADKKFISYFGKNATGCFGQCETQITLTGTPNQIIENTIQVSALPITKKSIMVNLNETIQTYQRTGGIQQGFFVLHCSPIPNGSSEKYRQTRCYSLPKLLIYARDRNPGEKIT